MHIATTPSTVRIGRRTFPFTSFEDVSQAYRSARDAGGYVSGCGMDRNGPKAPPCEILDGFGECIAWVSYNGRVWRGPLNNNNYDLVYDAGRNA